MRIFRKCCDVMDDAALYAIGKVSIPISSGLQFSRKAAVLDYFYTSTLRAINSVAFSLLHQEVIDPEARKTLVQRNREREILLFRELLGENKVYPEFCRETATYIHAAIPRFFGEQLNLLPGFTEGLLLFRAGLPFRYANYKINQRTGYREKLISSVFGKYIQGHYIGWRTQMAHLLAGKNQLEPLIHFEHLLLRLCVKFSGMYKRKPTRNLAGILLKSLGFSFEKQKAVDRYIQKMELCSEEESFIARLDWHKRDGSLPRGLPDPHQINLNTGNLNEKLDEALSQFMQELVTEFIKSSNIISLKGFAGFAYALEGRELLIQILTHLLSEFGVKQLTDPHLFSLAILYASGEEVADYELDGFGRHRRNKIHEVGSQILKEALNGKTSWRSINEIYERSSLKQSPGSLEGLLQKKEAKQHLRRYIATLIHEMIKGDQFKHAGLLKGVRERASRLPAIGMAALSLHFIINGTLFSFGYLFRDGKQADASFLTWMGKNFTGRRLCQFLADKIVDLIYHPSWRITLMQCIEHMRDAIQNANQPIEFSADDFKPITDFLFQHFIKDSQLPFEGNIAPLFDYFTGDEVFQRLKEYIKPTDQPLLEKAIEALLPTIKEQMLYTRVIDSFRKERISFDGDGKFWELFIRESLNRLVSGQFTDSLSAERASLQDLAALRNTFVERMLALNDELLRKFLSDIPNNRQLLRQRESFFSDSEESAASQNSGGILQDAIKWDYLVDFEVVPKSTPFEDARD